MAVRFIDPREVINQRLAERGMPATELARRSNVPYAVVWRGLMPNGTGRIRAEYFVRLCVVLDLKLSDFYADGGGADGDGVPVLDAAADRN